MGRTVTGILLATGAFASGILVDRHLLRPSGPATDAAPPPLRTRTIATGEKPEHAGHPAPDTPFASSADDLRGLVDPRSLHDAGPRVHRALDNATAVDLEKLIAGLAGSNTQTDRALRTTLYHRLAGLDPAAALDQLLAEDDFLTKASAIHGVFASLARTDPEAAKKALTAIENPELRNRALHGMAETIGQSSPHAFANYLATLPDGHRAAEFFRSWALRDPDAAIAFVANTEDPTRREHWSHGISHGLALSDPAAAVGWLSSLDPGNDAFHASAEPTIRILAQTDPLRAAGFLGELPPSHQRRELVEQLARTWSLSDLPAALEWAGTLDPRDRSGATNAILDSWARTDPAAAAGHLATLAPSESTLDLTHHLARRWAQSDPGSALAWALSQNGATRSRAIEGATSAWAGSDPETAADFALSLENPADQRHAVNAVARRWSQSDVVGAVGWIQDLPPDLQRDASRGLIDQLAEHDPRQAASVFEAVATLNGDTPAHLAAEITGRWGELAPAEAAAWASSLQPGAARNEAIESAAHHWVRSDPVAASEWISDLPEGRPRDAAAGQLVEHIAHTDPDRAFQWALTIGEEDRRADLLHHVVHQWSNTDAGAANSAISAAPIPENLRENLAREIAGRE